MAHANSGEFEGSSMVGAPGYIDGILRRREDYFTALFEGVAVVRQIVKLLGVVVSLSFLYGVVMGATSGWAQMLASGVKVPVLYLLTLLVCFPVLYVVNVIMGSRLSFSQTLALIMLALALNAILLASCAPIVLFFVFTGASYDFLKLLHVVVFGFSGAWGMLGLWRGLEAMCESSDLYPKQAVKILQVWIVVFAFVGMQTAWSLRPFVGSPDLPFEIFRKDQDSNIYQSVWASIVNLGDPESPESVTPEDADPAAATEAATDEGDAAE